MGTTVVRDHASTGELSRAEREACSDTELLDHVRHGIDDAFGELYQRHVGAASRFARQLTRSDAAAAADLVSDSFLAVMTALRNGSGPTDAFRPYLLTVVRRRSWRDGRIAEDPTDPTDDRHALDGEVLDPDGDDERIMKEAYRSLPERWQMVLWHTEIEGSTPAEVAPLVGLSPHATAALAHRAREGLREAYLQAHLQATPKASCRFTVTHLGGLVRDNLSARDRAKTEAHLAACGRCQGLRSELSHMNKALRTVVGPLVLGSAAAAYLSRQGASSAPAVSVGAASASGTGRRALLTGAAVAMAMSLLALSTDVAPRHDATIDASALAPAADGSATPGSATSDIGDSSQGDLADPLPLPGGVSVALRPGQGCLGSNQLGTVLTPVGSGEATVVRAVLFQGNPLGLSDLDLTAAITPITGALRSTLQDLSTTGATVPTGGSGDSGACLTVPTTTLLSGTGPWRLLISYLPNTLGALQFAVLQQPFALLDGLTRQSVTAARSAAADLLAALLPSAAGALPGLDDLTALLPGNTTGSGSGTGTLDGLLPLGTDPTGGASGGGATTPSVTVPPAPTVTIPPVALPGLPGLPLPTLPTLPPLFP